MARTARRLGLAVVVTALGLGATAAGPASADNDVVMTRPLAGERLDARPDAVTVVLTEPAKGTTRIAVEDADGTEVSTGAATVVSTNLAAQLPPDIAPGVYTVTFRTDTSRGPEGGSYQFAYKTSEAMTIDGVDRWRGYSEIPDAVSDPGDAAAAAAASASPTPTASTTAGPVDGGSDVVAPADRNAASRDANSTSWWPWAVAAGVALLTLLLVFRRRGTAAEDDESTTD